MIVIFTFILDLVFFPDEISFSEFLHSGEKDFGVPYVALQRVAVWHICHRTRLVDGDRVEILSRRFVESQLKDFVLIGWLDQIGASNP